MKAHVLALGNSIKSYQPTPGIITVGVNDIFKYVKTDYLFCGDTPARFSRERFLTIRTSTPKKFYSHLACWKPFFGEKYTQIEYAKLRGDVSELDSEKYIHSICSPFVACHIAYKLGAKEITLFGVDLMNHPVFNNQVNKQAEEKLTKIKKHFSDLRRAMGKRSVSLLLGNPESSALAEVFR